MFSEVLEDIARPSYLGIIGELKRSGGLSVSDLARKLEMSYMGVKQHCITLEAKGYLETWRVPRKKVGRPQKLYKLTPKCHPLFPSGGIEVIVDLLENVSRTFGETAPEKLLYHYFENQRDAWIKEVQRSKSLAEKTCRLVEARLTQGHVASCEHSKKEGLIIEEYHHPLAKIFELYPRLKSIEISMMEQTLGAQITYSEKEGDQSTKRDTYKINTLA